MLFTDRPFVRVPEGSRTGEPDALQPSAHRPEIRVLPQADPYNIIVHDLPDLVIKFLAASGSVSVACWSNNASRSGLQ